MKGVGAELGLEPGITPRLTQQGSPSTTLGLPQAAGVGRAVSVVGRYGVHQKAKTQTS